MRNVLTLFLASWATFQMSAANAECPAADRISDNVCLLTDRFNPNPSGSYSPPTCSDIKDANNPIVQAISRAYTIAPPKLKQELCHLKRIIIAEPTLLNPIHRFSFGYYENPRNNKWSSDPGSYVVLLLNDLDTTLKDREDRLVDDNTREGGSTGLARHSVTKPDGSAIDEQLHKDLGLLSLLAHEIGHIKWHRDNMPFSLWCYKPTFLAASWDDYREDLSRRWTQYKERSGRHKKGTPHPHDRLTAAQLRDIYDRLDDGFVTAFASISPEEDFVETYKMVALRESTAQFGMRLTFSSGLPDVDVKGNPNPAVVAKRGCVEKLPDLSATR